MELPSDKEQVKLKKLAESLKGVKSPYDRFKIYYQITDIIDPYLTKELTKRIDKEFENFASVKED